MNINIYRDVHAQVHTVYYFLERINILHLEFWNKALQMYRWVMDRKIWLKEVENHNIYECFLTAGLDTTQHSVTLCDMY